MSIEGQLDLWLEESFILGWTVQDAKVELLATFCLLPEHELYERPGKGEWGCYRNGRIVAKSVIETLGFDSLVCEPIWNSDLREYEDVSEIDQVNFGSNYLEIVGDNLRIRISAEEILFKVDTEECFDHTETND